MIAFQDLTDHDVKALDHRLDTLTPQERFDEDCRMLLWYHEKGRYGKVWIEEKYLGRPCFNYRLGDLGGSSRYRLVGYVTAHGVRHYLDVPRPSPNPLTP